jgi:hypothetical protein
MPQTFADLIESATHGEINETATKEMASLVNEMQTLERTIGGKQKGTLTLKLSFSLERGVFDTQAEVSVKRPPKAKPRAFLYATKDGGLSEEDTRQGRLDFGTAKDVSTPSAANVRSLDDKRMAQANDK